jgi:glycosyltransferase involved in cell wall biosynthesis
LKKIAVLVPNSYQIDQRVIRETESLGRNGYIPYIFATPGPQGARFEHIERDNIVIAETVPKLTYLIRKPAELRKYSDVAKAVYRQKTCFDEVYSHDLSVSTVGYFLAKKMGIPQICDFHELFMDYLPGGENRMLRRGVLQVFDLAWRAIGGKVVRSANGFITVNDSIAEIYRKRWGLSKSPTVLHNYSSKNFNPQKRIDRRYFYERFNIERSKKILLLQGRLSKGRGVEIAYSAFKDQRDFAVVFLGYGALVNRIADYQGLHPGVFHYHEPVPASELAAYTRCADLCLAAVDDARGNNIYSSPNKIYEYLAAGIPFICSDLPEMRRIATDTSAGVTVPLNDPSMLYEAARDIFQNSRHQRMAEAARDAFHTRYCWEAEEQKLLRLFAQVV